MQKDNKEICYKKNYISPQLLRNNIIESEALRLEQIRRQLLNR